MRRAANNLDIGMSIYSFYETNWTFINIEYIFVDDGLSDDESDDDDVNRYGPAYAKYKRRVLNRNNYFDGVVDDDGDYISDMSDRSDD